MKKGCVKFFIIILLAVSVLACAPIITNLKPDMALEKNVMAATFVVHGVSNDGERSSIQCTATAYERQGNVYRFVTASHCLVERYKNNKFVRLADRTWYLTNDFVWPFGSRDPKLFYPAKPVAVGNPSLGYDMAVLEATIDSPTPTICLAEKDLAGGEAVFGVGASRGNLKQIYRGAVTGTQKDFGQFVPKGALWKNVILLDLSRGATGSGNSGLAIISTKTGAISAILAGWSMMPDFLTLNIVAVPISQFKEFLATRITDLMAPKSSPRFSRRLMSPQE